MARRRVAREKALMREHSANIAEKDRERDENNESPVDARTFEERKESAREAIGERQE